MENEIKKKLDKLAEFRAESDAIQSQKQEILDGLIPPEIKSKMDEVEAEFAGREDAVGQNIAALEAEIKSDTVQHGATVKGEFLQAVFSHGKMSYSDKPKAGYVEVTVYRKEGNPYASIVSVKKK